ncbi:MAG: hypothetical protein RDU14_07735 [Melioribacteraceae bacterium]|nr:hypothetical protein [Melioribacteraceae bacterium]
MKNMFIKILCISVLSMFLISCYSTTDLVFKPEINFRSPKLDFTKVQAIATMPVNCYSDEIPEISQLINDGLPSELKRSQMAWNVISYDNVLRTVNDKGLGRGYQNYVADLNTYVSAAGATPNFTAETQIFFEQLKNEMNLEAILFTSYGFIEQTVMVKRLLADQPVVRKTLSVTVILYEISSKRTWWIARLTLRGSDDYSNSELARKVIEGIANNFGKGELRQL